MKFKVTKSSDYTYESTIEINTLEELIEFQKTCGCEIILIDENEIETQTTDAGAADTETAAE